MITIIYGTDLFLIKKYIKKIKKEFLIDNDEFSFENFDYIENSLDEIIESMSFLPLGADKKTIIVRNCDFLSNAKLNKEQEKLFDALKKIDGDIDIVLITNKAKIAVTNPISKYVKDKFNSIKELVSIAPHEWFSYASKKFINENVSITKEAINEMIYRCKNNLELFENEFKKVKNYSSSISIEDIKKLISEPIDENNFSMVNYLLSGDISNAIKSYRGMVLNGVEPVVLIAMLTTQIKFYDEVLYLAKCKKMSNYDIAKELNCNDKRVYYTLKNCSKYDCDKIGKILHILYEADYNIKAGLVDRFYFFELSLLKIKEV